MRCCPGQSRRCSHRSRSPVHRPARPPLMRYRGPRPRSVRPRPGELGVDQGDRFPSRAGARRTNLREPIPRCGFAVAGARLHAPARRLRRAAPVPTGRTRIQRRRGGCRPVAARCRDDAALSVHSPTRQHLRPQLDSWTRQRCGRCRVRNARNTGWRPVVHGSPSRAPRLIQALAVASQLGPDGPRSPLPHNTPSSTAGHCP